MTGRSAEPRFSGSAEVLVSASAIAAVLAGLGALAALVGSTMFFTSIASSGCLVLAGPRSAATRLASLGAGHAIACAAGLTATIAFPESIPAASIAVGLSVLVMWRFDALHPPAAANPLILFGGAAALPLILGFIALGVALIAGIRLALDAVLPLPASSPARPSS